MFSFSTGLLKLWEMSILCVNQPSIRDVLVKEQSGWAIKLLVGGWTNPFEKYDRQIGSFPPGFRVENKNVWNHHLD